MHDTYHLIAKSKEKDTLFGDMEFWIDKKTWMPLKSITTGGDVTSTTEYTKYEPNAKGMLDGLLVLPESTGYTIEDMHIDTNEISINYVKDDVLQFSISVFKPTEPLTDIESPITVRGFEGSTDDLGFRFLQWDENGLCYNVLFQDQSLSYDEFVKLAEKMEVAK